jgi:hypothetical protein
VRYVRCIRWFVSKLSPELDFGVVGRVYMVREDMGDYWDLHELGPVSKVRFEEVTVK